MAGGSLLFNVLLALASVVTLVLLEQRYEPAALAAGIVMSILLGSSHTVGLSNLPGCRWPSYHQQSRGPA